MDRIEALEQSLRRWKWATVALGGVGLAAGAAQQAAPRAEVTELKVLDESGQQRIRLDANWGGNGPAIVLYGKTGKPLATLSVDNLDDDASFKMLDHQTGRNLIRIDSLNREGKVEVSNSKQKTARLAAPGSSPF